MHNNTHSVHNRLLKSWQDRLPFLRSCCYVFLPPLSGTNCCPSPFPGGAGPPNPRMASLFPGFPGFAHTLSLPSVTSICSDKCRDLSLRKSLIQDWSILAHTGEIFGPFSNFPFITICSNTRQRIFCIFTFLTVTSNGKKHFVTENNM